MEKIMARKINKDELIDYSKFLITVKDRIRQSQVKAALSANTEMIIMYWDIGRMIDEKQKKEGWGASVIPHLSKDIQNELPEIKGFSERNIGYMIRFSREYPNLLILQQPVAKLTKQKSGSKGQQLVAQPNESNMPQLVAKLPWGHNVLLMQKIKDINIRFWYVQKTLENGWSRNVLNIMIESDLYKRRGKAVTNFKTKLPSIQSDLATQVLKDPYIFDFLTLEEPFHERELEVGLLKHLKKFLIELGQGFAFVGRQYHLEIGENHHYYIDLLFYHLKLRSYVIIELKKGDFKPEYTGKINFYCNVVDDTLKHKTDNQTIGLILCQNKKKILAEYALRGIDKPVGISEYKLTRILPKKLKSVLPTIKEIEKEMSKKKI